MIVCQFKVVKAAVLALSIFTLVGCGGGGSSTGSITHGASSSSGSTPAPTPTPTPDSDIFSGTGSVSLSWLPPTENTDGSALTNLSGYRIYVNSGSGFVQAATLNNQSVSSYLVENLISGTYIFAVSAFDSTGIESALSTGVTVSVS